MPNALCFTFNNGRLTPGIVVRRYLHQRGPDGLETLQGGGFKVGETVTTCYESGASQCSGPDRYFTSFIVGPPSGGDAEGVIVETGDARAGFRLFRLSEPLNLETVAAHFDHRSVTGDSWTAIGSESGLALDRGYVIFMDAERQIRAVPLGDFTDWVQSQYAQASASLLALAQRFTAPTAS